MKKGDLIERLEKLLEEKGMYRIDGVNLNSNKASIQTAIKSNVALKLSSSKEQAAG